eukprot:2860474-Prorocentrum_lima.AAC.1
MTSSLVGSEMCIRDSRLTPTQSVISATRRRSRFTCTGGTRTGPKGLSPVSYTHLTLPTICSV